MLNKITFFFFSVFFHEIYANVPMACLNAGMTMNAIAMNIGCSTCAI